MWFSRLFKGAKKSEGDEAAEPTLDQGIYYVYLIIFLQIALVLGLVTVIMFAGKILATPTWVFVVAIGLGIWGCVYVFKKAKEQIRKLREALQHVNLSNKNFQISFMKGFLTMRVEQSSQQMLEAPPAASPRLIEADQVVDTTIVPPAKVSES